MFVSIETTSYSGATLLAMLLSVHPDVATTGELNGIVRGEDVETYQCSCGSPIRACPFWAELSARLAARGVAFDVSAFDLGFERPRRDLAGRVRDASLGHPSIDAVRDAIVARWPAEAASQRRLVHRNEEFVRSVLAMVNAQVFVDTSKDPQRLHAMTRRSGLETRAIHLVRDVRGVVASRLRRGVGLDARGAAREWVRHHVRIDRRLDALPTSHRLRVRYEDLCRAPDATLAEIWRFLALEPVSVAWPVEVREQHVVGNPIRLRPIDALRLDERWRELPHVDLAAIEAVAGTESRRLGYVGE